ncbi:PTS mannitol transporter subunit IICBA [Streptococcus suis]|uniref:PTS mannitol-specific transporter subunit IIBC n=1 Tax=Streptococcus suis TaxID=1307 RepID=UPI000423A5EE|nr:PTS mannitol-specific transporter subunit IIBC [Streptococcus suis]MBM0240607.1 PTS mannitol transporter subunit IICBA [Streptococcus suis]MBM7280902.1 PTS mannitol transporter subunit IICBA [Streptococcus suis]MBO4134405.1 PTS mannitol transporter subunit IICBA [Streptococcus suis]HEM3429382.1 PTS mannitol transporter subunit IICBA [Streptococcus suis]HEM3452033.1 PTS mannitol transporter subunit IICBA [Streptococcus suis]
MENSSLRVRLQKLGTTLSNMVMPNIGAFIAWGVLTSLFIPTGWLPNETFATIVGPMITYLLPLLIGYTGGYNVYGQRGGVMGAILTMGVIAGSSVPMFIGAMVVGPLGAMAIKKFDEKVQPKIRPGFEMLVNNFSAGLIGFTLMLVAFKVVGPFVESMTGAIGNGVQAIVDMKLLPIANIIIEPAKILFLNNALNHGIFTPLGTEQVLEAGKSVLFLLEANPGPGLGILLAYAFFGKGSAKSSSWGAMVIHFLGGIHEIYFPYVMMKPALFLAAIAGGVSGTFVFQTLNAGLAAAASPGSIIAIWGMVPKGDGYLGNLISVLAGVLAGALASFLVAAIILKADKSEGESLEAAQAATKAAKAVAKGQAVETVAAEISANSVKQIIFACDAGMGSSAMGASLLREKVKKAGLDIPVTNKAIANLQDTEQTLIVTQQELADRAAQRTPRAIHVAVDNFLTSPKYDEIVAKLLGQPVVAVAARVSEEANQAEIDLNYIDEVVFAYGQSRGSATMGQTTLTAIFKNKGIGIPVASVPFEQLAEHNAKNILIVTTISQQAEVQQAAPNAQLLVVDSLVTTPEYDKIVARMHK